MATAFHPFGLLPLELRQHIWELSMTPRRVPVGYMHFSKRSLWGTPRPPPSSPPAVLHACAESRSHLVRYYTKIHTEGSLSRYIWVNYEIDTICMNEYSVHDLQAELLPIKHLSVIISDEESFLHGIMCYLRWMSSLENLEIKPSQKGICWWYGWDDVLAELHYSGETAPVRFRTIILCPMPDHEVQELTTDNYIKVEREYRRRDMAENPEKYIGVEMSDSDDDSCRSG